MSDIKLFSLVGGAVTELNGSSMAMEKSLQHLIERNLETFLGIRFLASEFSTGKEHGGRMDTLGIDENGCPVIIEYKRATNENVINQGLFYLDWLMDHQKDFEWLVMETYGKEVAESVEWSAPRLLCIAGDFTKYDGHAVKQMNRNIELIRYRHYENDLLLLDLVNAASSNQGHAAGSGTTTSASTHRTVTQGLESASQSLRDRFEGLKDFLLGLGDDVQVKTLKNYVAFSRIKNFACVEVRNNLDCVLIHIKVDPSTIDLEEGFTRDVSNKGHFGTGNLEIRLKDWPDLEKAKPLLEQSYEMS
ncbi:DUF5655 domain-containing protein [Terasakiella pusilla]|uniref:DUF5655 domain-containing protein n=1 Tax=Terasakiella pusilla TaxID=64973 RepID=UPI003AA8EB84